MKRIVCWFSCGAASAVATKLVIDSNSELKLGREIIIARNHVLEEHPDNERFASDCESWFGQKIVNVTNEKYEGSAAKVWEAVKYLKNTGGAPCTRLLKKDMRKAFQRHDDIHVFGYTADEQDRVDQLIDGEPEIKLWLPLIEMNFTKADCLNAIMEARIELPAMYKLGYLNNNCIGCVKGAMGYWNKIRRDFPEKFAEMAIRERTYGYALNKRERRIAGQRVSYPVFLDELPLDAGDYVKEPSIECGIICETPQAHGGE